MDRNVVFEWGKEKNEFGEPILSCEGNFPHIDDRIKIRISGPSYMKTGQCLKF